MFLYEENQFVQVEEVLGVMFGGLIKPSVTEVIYRGNPVV
jgi:hypothetical protein